jgi:hypothetical protein
MRFDRVENHAWARLAFKLVSAADAATLAYHVGHVVGLCSNK